MTPETNSATPVLRLAGIHKSYGSVSALRGVTVEVNRGEIHALLGDNGAGKSTLLKIAAGATSADAGDIEIDGKATHYRTPHEARDAGIETVYQDLALALDRSSVANIFAGREILYGFPFGVFGLLNRRAMLLKTEEAFKRLDVPVTRPEDAVRNLSGGQRQAVAIARAATWATKVILLDEPTAALSVRQRENVLKTVARLRDHGLAVLLVTHNIAEILGVADRVTVVRRGEVADSAPASTVDVSWVVHAMVGQSEMTPLPEVDLKTGGAGIGNDADF